MIRELKGEGASMTLSRARTDPGHRLPKRHFMQPPPAPKIFIKNNTLISITMVNQSAH